MRTSDPLGDAVETASVLDGARRAVRPRDAATLILLDRSTGGPRLLMGRRAGGHDFMPNLWVFPGGRIHPADFRVPLASDLRPDVAVALARSAPLPRARALALAAVRETFEETGLLLARPASRPRASRGAWSGFLARGVLPDLGALTYVARAVTPPARHKRFDARFFMADAAALVSRQPAGGSGELLDLAWLPLDEARAMPALPGVTRLVLAEVAARLTQPDRPIPFWRFRGGQAMQDVA